MWFCFGESVFDFQLSFFRRKTMSSRKHVDLLRSGGAKFDAWREAHPQVVIDLSGAHLPGINLKGVNLASANLTGANLEEASLPGADLGGAVIDLECAKTMLPIKAISRAGRNALVEHLDSLVVG
jgi:uncharacterized protein YjbI with pentapeptide repeats